MGIIEQAGEGNIRVLFVQPQVSSKGARIIAKEIGCKVLTADPLALDWQNNLLNVARSFGGIE